MASQPAKRVRTGCLKCRVRRRKCDEGKPRCQRCITGGFECQYGTRLSFLDKNAFTVEEASASTKETAPTPGYRKVQFVDDDTSNSPPPGEQQHRPLQSQMPPIERTLQSKPQEYEPITKSVGSSAPQDSDQIDEGGHMNDAQDPSTPFTSWSPSALQTPQTSGGDQIALDALLSLGHEHANVFVDRNVHRNSISSVTFHNQSTNVFEDVFASHENSVHDTALPSTVLTDPENGTKDEYEYKLLKHYRYEVAPWLDICDLSQTFGMAVVCQAGESPVILGCVQELSELSMRSLSMTNYESVADLEPHRDDNSIDLSNAEERLLCTSLSQATDPFRQVDQSLADGVSDSLDAAHKLVMNTPTPVAVAAYHLMMRFALSKAFLHELPISKITFHVPETLPSQWHKTELANQVFQYAHIPMSLCFRVLKFCWGEPSNSVGLAGDMVSSWRALIEELNLWYSQRPQEFLSMVEIESTDDGYPMVLFTNGAAVFGNQLYHTAMFLLLRHKPRTVILPSRHRSSTMSALWHARRICGIALNNERRDCWDLSLVASLLVAARTMTHEAQHEVLLDGTYKIERLTGWSLGVARDTLKAEWGI